jgi:hypothetical protein
MSHDKIPTQPSRALLYNFGANRTGHSIINETLKHTPISICNICESVSDQTAEVVRTASFKNSDHMPTRERERGVSLLRPHLRTSRFRFPT